MENLKLNCDSFVLSNILSEVENIDYDPVANVSLTYRELQAVVTVLYDVYNSFVSMQEEGKQFTPNAKVFLDDLESAYDKLNESH